MILTGYPCSGKTRLAELIQERVRHRYSNRIRKVVIINERSACSGSTIAQCYETAWNEKQTRGALKSSFDRAVGSNGDDTLIILDSTNYIKGFRYELYCISKAAGTAHCVVWCINDVTTVTEWNQKRREQQQNSTSVSSLCTYPDEQMQALIQRYEPPDERNRWDRPLYQVDLRPIPQKEIHQAASAVLTSSVYNMHNLSQVLTATSNTLEKQQEETEESGEDVAPKPVASSTFKRANFKRSTHAQITRSVATPSSTLTAEALLAFDSSSKQSTQSSNQALDERAERTVDPIERNLGKEKLVVQQQEPTAIEDRVDQILEMFLCNVKPLTEGTSTRQHVPSDANVLHQVDSITQKLCSSVWEAQNKSATGIGRIPIPWDGATLYLESNKRWQLSELRSFQRQFLQWILTHPPRDVSAKGIADHFLAYIATHS